MKSSDYRDYGPMQRRGQPRSKQGDMATPYTGPTVTMPTIKRKGPSRGHTPGPGSRSRGVIFWLMVLVLVGVGGATYAGTHYLDQRYSGHIYPNVSLQGVPVGEMTPQEAEQAVHQRFDAFAAAPLSVEFAGQSWHPSGAEVGIGIDVSGQVATALRAGRDNGLVKNVRQLWDLEQKGLDLPLAITFDQGQVQRYLEKISAGLQHPPVEAALTIDQVTGAVAVTEGREGQIVLVDDTIADVQHQLTTLAPFTVPLSTRTVKPLMTNDGIAEAKRTVDAMLQGPMEFKFKDQTYVLKQADIANMIVQTRVAGTSGPILNAQIDQKQLKKWVIRVADQVGRDSVEPRVAWDGGNLQIIQPGRSAYRVDIDRALVRLNEAVISANRSLELPVDEVQPRVTPETLTTLGIKDVVGQGRTDFTGSAAYRITNIKAGVKLMNGILIPPDGEFSFDENVGAIDEAHGFTEGYAIIGNRTQQEPGGGICQVSTTLFRAAFYAGLPFSDWTPHRFRISWYEKYDSIGMDSTIFTGGGPDLRFVNNTGHWLLLEGKVDDAKAMVTMTLYGTKIPGQVVQRTEPEITNETPAPKEAVYIDDPKEPAGSFHQTDAARGGLDIKIDRVILQDGQVKNRRSFITRFQPWPNIFLKNPQTPLPPGGKLGNG